jgi:lipopolysaccharide heptosyltransferase II
MMTRILIVNPFGIGDVLFARPLIAALKQRYPGVSISCIGNARTQPLLAADPQLDRVFSYERDDFMAVYRRSKFGFVRRWTAFTAALRAERFDAAFDLSLGGPLALALLLAGIPRRIGYDYKGRGRWLTHKIPLQGYEGRHAAQYGLALLSGLPADFMTVPEVPFIPLTLNAADAAWRDDFLIRHHWAAGGYDIIHPGGGASWGKGAGLKRWPAVNFAKLADKMIEKGSRPIILLGDASEVSLCRQVAEAMKHPAMVLAGQLTLMQAAALMPSARRVIVNDGGPLHLAVAFGARTVSVFGPVDPVVYGPYPRGGHAVVQKGLACQPCYRHFRMSDCAHQSCLKELSVDDVFKVITEMI